MAVIKVIYGPPCSGKSTYVNDELGERDIKFDYDSIMQSISSRESHEYSDEHLPYVVEYRGLIINKASSDSNLKNAYIIATRLTDKLKGELEGKDVEYILMEATKEKCFEYLESDETRKDKSFWTNKISEWFEWHEEYLSNSEEVRIMNKRHMHFTSELKTRVTENEDEAVIEGYFVVYDQETELWPGAFEEVAPGAFEASLRDSDIMCLDNHDSRIILGSVGSNTLELKSDSKGLWGRATIDLEDPNAKSAYRKVETGKVRGCSFGFYPTKEERIENDDGTTKWRITEAELLEVSITAFPAYPQTDIAARQKDVEAMKKQKLEQRKKQLKEKMSK